MRILHVLDHSVPLHSGYTFRTAEILKHQQKLGIETFQLTGPKHFLSSPSVEDVDGLRFYRSAPVGKLSGKIPVLNQYAVVLMLRARLLEMVETIQPDIIHAHSPALDGMAAIQVGRKHSIPVVYEVRAFWEDAAVDHGTSSEWGLRYRLSRMLETHVLKRANAVTVICEGLKNEIITRGIDANKITVIPNAVNYEKFSVEGIDSSDLLIQYGLEGRTVLGFIGSFYAYEGLDILVDALPGIVEKNNNIRLLLVGGGPDESDLKKRVSALNLDSYVIFTGRVPHDDVMKYYDLIDIFVYPRKSMRLTELVTPLKPLEAMASGKLVLASDIGGHRELIRHNENGYLFAPESGIALTECVLTLLDNRSTWLNMQQHARDYVKSERNWVKSVASYLPLYERLCCS